MIFLSFSSLSRHNPFIFSHSFFYSLISMMQTSYLIHFIELIPRAFSLCITPFTPKSCQEFLWSESTWNQIPITNLRYAAKNSMINGLLWRSWWEDVKLIFVLGTNLEGYVFLWGWYKKGSQLVHKIFEDFGHIDYRKISISFDDF
jgi:hypothetical protein